MLLGPISRSFDSWRDEARRLRRIEMLLRRAAMRWSKSHLFMAFNYLYDLCEALRLRELEFCAHLTTTYRHSHTKSQPGPEDKRFAEKGAAPESAGIEMISPGAPKTCANTLYVIGGQDGLGRTTPMIEKMNAVNGRWGLEGEYLGTARLGHGVVVAQGLIYTIGGRGQQVEGSKSLERFRTMDVLSTTDGVAILKPGPSMSEKRNNLAVAYLKNKIYASGGSNGHSKAMSSVEVFDVGTGEWGSCADMLKPRISHMLAAVQGKLYAISGGDGDGIDVTSVESYNPVSDKWTEVAPLKTSRVQSAVATHSGFIYVFGGACRSNAQSTMLTSVERYDPKKDKWTKMTPLPFPRAQASAVSCGGFIYLVGGIAEDVDRKYPLVLDSVIRYDVNTNTWTEMPPLSMKRSHHCVAAARLAIDSSMM